MTLRGFDDSMEEALVHDAELFVAPKQPDDFNVARIRWLIRMRWVAMLGVLFAALVCLVGLYEGVAWPVLAMVAALGSTYNLLLLRGQREVTTGRQAAVAQALVDIGLLTLVLWAAGGLQTPFLGFYVFHVALIAILGGPRATVVAGMMACAAAGFLALVELYPALQIGVWAPAEPWDVVAEVLAFVITLGAAAYIVSHAASELRDRERALARARDRAELNFQVLTNTLDELDAGLEVVDAERRIEWRNRKAERLSPVRDETELWSCAADSRQCERSDGEYCPATLALEKAQASRCRFHVDDAATRRVYEMLSFPLSSRSGVGGRVMNLYLDRTQMVVAERRLLVAERLASLGRITQGVAHELNTPLSTIQTLAADMLKVTAAGVGDPRSNEDLTESASLIRDETARLGKITQSLLAGGDLRTPQLRAEVALGPIIDRAVALVFAGAAREARVHIDKSVYGARVEGDADRLVQVLVNLIQNARDAVREVGGGAIEIWASEQGDSLELNVDDEGAGIDPAIAPKLFEPFATTKPPGKGTGLGLYASYMLVQGMGGDLRVEPRATGGVRASVRLRPSASQTKEVVQ